MNHTEGSKHDASHQLSKAPTGILGFDEITNGGLPQGRPTKQPLQHKSYRRALQCVTLLNISY